MKKFSKIKKGSLDHEVTMMKLGQTYKVTKRIPEMSQAETKFFDSETKAKEYYRRLRKGVK